MSKLLAKQFYLDQIKKDNAPHRKIANRMVGKFDISPALVKNELLKDGYIAIAKTVKISTTQKLNYYFKLTEKKFQNVEEIETSTEEVKQIYCATWEDGTPKSRGNAFDLLRTRGLFNKSELAASQNKGKPLNYNTQVQVIAYSRA